MPIRILNNEKKKRIFCGLQPQKSSTIIRKIAYLRFYFDQVWLEYQDPTQSFPADIFRGAFWPPFPPSVFWSDRDCIARNLGLPLPPRGPKSTWILFSTRSRARLQMDKIWSNQRCNQRRIGSGGSLYFPARALKIYFMYCIDYLFGIYFRLFLAFLDHFYVHKAVYNESTA